MAAVHAERWQDTRVYALFRNEWSELLFMHLRKVGKDFVRLHSSKYILFKFESS